jgi:predicted helicase
MPNGTVSTFFSPTRLTDRYDHRYRTEEILSYVFAVLHAKTYRDRYLDFLRTDFPRIPFPKDRKNFDALSKLGRDLLDANARRVFMHDCRLSI